MPASACFRIDTICVSLNFDLFMVFLLAVFCQDSLPMTALPSGEAYGVTTSTVTVPLITALGLGLSEAVPGRSPLLDGFGLVAFASLFPIISVLAYGQLAVLRERVSVPGKKTRNPEEENNNAL